MAFFEDYEPISANPKTVAETGDYRVRIVSVAIGVSTSSKRHLSIDLVTDDEQEVEFTLYLEEGEQFNRDATLFYDTFGITRGSTDTDSWIDSTGYINIKLQDSKMLFSWIVSNDGYACNPENSHTTIAFPKTPELPNSIF